MAGAYTRGVLFVHSTTRALCPHIEWAAGNALGVRVSIDWTEQPAERDTYRGEYSWQGAQGIAAKMSTVLRGWPQLRFEVTEEPSAGVDGGRWSHTPTLGIFHAATDVYGNLMIPEDRIRDALASNGDSRSLREALDLVLGKAWDDELEPFRYAGAGAPVRWLHQVG